MYPGLSATESTSNRFYIVVSQLRGKFSEHPKLMEAFDAWLFIDAVHLPLGDWPAVDNGNDEKRNAQFQLARPHR